MSEQENKDVSSIYFLSLGAGKHQVPLIQAAKDLGYKVIAVDKNPNAPGFVQADLKMYSSILKPKKILKTLYANLLSITDLAGVGTRSFGRACYSATLIAKKCSLPGPSPKKLEIFRNKVLLKKLANKLKIPCAPSYLFNNKKKSKEINLQIDFQKHLPLVVRPIFGHGKKGVLLLDRVEDVNEFLKKNKTLNNFLLDKYIEGREITVIGLVSNGRFQLSCITEKHVAKYFSYFIELQHHFPVQIEKDVIDKICNYLQRICDDTNLDYCPLVAEFIISDYNEKMPICLIECSPEVGGEYLADTLIPIATGQNYFQDLIKVYTGQNITSNNFQVDEKNMRQINIRFIPQKTGTLKKIEFPKTLKAHKGFLFSKILKEAGEHTSLERANLDRLAVFALQSSAEDQKIYQDVEQIVNETIIEYE